MSGQALALRVLGAWAALALLLYAFRLPSTLPASYLNDNDALQVDAVVYIAMNATAARNNVDYSIASLRNVGRWRGDVYVLTDQPGWLRGVETAYSAKLVHVPSQRSLTDIKALKPDMMSYLPAKVQTAMYVDVDILVVKPLQLFLQTIKADISWTYRKARKQLPNKDASLSAVDVAMFPDARGHYVGWCAGCEKWHTGVILLHRHGAGNDSCMRAWAAALRSGAHASDQQAMDAAEAAGDCPLAVALSPQHLLFAKDYLGTLLVSGQTFVHLTGVERMHQQDYFYREIVAPRLYRSLEPHVSRSILVQNKSFVEA